MKIFYEIENNKPHTIYIASVLEEKSRTLRVRTGSQLYPITVYKKSLKPLGGRGNIILDFDKLSDEQKNLVEKASSIIDDFSNVAYLEIINEKEFIVVSYDTINSRIRSNKKIIDMVKKFRLKGD